MKLILKLKGGKGSGNFGHAGIPGHQGGSKPSGGGGAMNTEEKARVNAVMSALGVSSGDVEQVKSNYDGDSWSISLRVLAPYDENKPNDDYYANRVFNKLVKSLHAAGYKKVSGGRDSNVVTYRNGKRGEGTEINIDQYTSGSGGGANEAFDVRAFSH